MLSDYKVFDAHCDSVTVKNLLHTKTHLDPRGMRKYGGYIQVFAICAEGGCAYSHNSHFIRRYERLVSNWGLEKILCKDDLVSTAYGAILAVEGADAIHNLSSLRMFYGRGVRALTLTWNNNNAVSSSIMSEKDGGLTIFGEKVVRECENLGILVDLSHISDKGFSDVTRIARKPFICSHSNSRTQMNHRRNITDEQFCQIIKCGGVSGINFVPFFLGENASINDIVRHIEHFCGLGGEKNIGIGSDFDGALNMPGDFSRGRYMGDIAEALLLHNYSEETVRNILYGNFFRVFRQILN